MKMLEKRRVALCAGMAALITVAAFGGQQDLPAVSHDGLELIPETEVAAAYVRPGADFSDYDRILILDAYVAFKKGWVQDQRRSSVRRVTSRDVERIKREMAKLFREVFVEELEKKGGYEVVRKADMDVLLLRPAIIDLEVTAPDVSTPDRAYSFAASAGAATLFLEIYDSVSGEILARVFDRQAASDVGRFMRWTNKSTNVVAARRVLAGWAGLLRERLDEVHERGKE